MKSIVIEKHPKTYELQLVNGPMDGIEVMGLLAGGIAVYASMAAGEDPSMSVADSLEDVLRHVAELARRIEAATKAGENM